MNSVELEPDIRRLEALFPETVGHRFGQPAEISVSVVVPERDGQGLVLEKYVVGADGHTRVVVPWRHRSKG